MKTVWFAPLPRPSTSMPSVAPSWVTVPFAWPDSAERDAVRASRKTSATDGAEGVGEGLVVAGGVEVAARLTEPDAVGSPSSVQPATSSVAAATDNRPRVRRPGLVGTVRSSRPEPPW